MDLVLYQGENDVLQINFLDVNGGKFSLGTFQSIIVNLYYISNKKRILASYTQDSDEMTVTGDNQISVEITSDVTSACPVYSLGVEVIAKRINPKLSLNFSRDDNAVGVRSI